MHILIVAAFAFSAPQEGAEAFRAISDLVELPDSRKEEVEREGRKLAPFYREFLESELKAKRELGALFGNAPRIRLKGKGRTFQQYLADLKNLGGNPASGDLASSKAPFDVDLEAWPIEAMALLCERAGHRPSNYSPWLEPNIFSYPISHESAKAPAGRTWFFYRNFAIVASTDGWRKSVDFSGTSKWTTEVRCKLLTDPRLPAVRCLKPRLIEALDEKGNPIPQVPDDETSLPPDEWRSTWVEPMSIGLRLEAEKVTKISRLRLAFNVQIPTEVRRYAATEFDPAKPIKTGDDFFDVEFAMQEGKVAANDCVVARVVPKKVAHADLLGVPWMLYQKFDNHGCGYPSGRLAHFTGKGAGMSAGTSWCTVRPADQVPARLVEGYMAIRRPVRVEVAIPVELKERTIYAEYRDIPLR